MATIAQLWTGIGARLDTIDGLRGSAHEADKIVVPAYEIGLPEEIDYDITMGRGVDRYQFVIRLYVSRATDKAGQVKLAGYMNPSGATSIKAAVEGDRTLGLANTDARVLGVSGVGVYEVGSAQYMGAEFTVQVHTSGA